MIASGFDPSAKEAMFEVPSRSGGDRIGTGFRTDKPRTMAGIGTRRPPNAPTREDATEARCTDKGLRNGIAGKSSTTLGGRYENKAARALSMYPCP